VARPIGKIVLGVVAVTVPLCATAAPLFFIAAAPACSDHKCEAKNPQDVFGRWVDEDTWESNGIEDSWTFYDAEGTLALHFDKDGGPSATREVVEHFAWVAVDQDAGTLGATSALASGNLAVWLDLVQDGVDNRMWLQNQTCSWYYVRVVVRFAHATPEAGAGDAGVEASASDADAGAPSDAATEGG
jgi:hypothetical protein